MRRSSNPRTAKFQIRDNTFRQLTANNLAINPQLKTVTLFFETLKMPTKLTLHCNSKRFVPSFKFNTYTDRSETIMENDCNQTLNLETGKPDNLEQVFVQIHSTSQPQRHNPINKFVFIATYTSFENNQDSISTSKPQR